MILKKYIKVLQIKQKLEWVEYLKTIIKKTFITILKAIKKCHNWTKIPSILVVYNFLNRNLINRFLYLNQIIYNKLISKENQNQMKVIVN
jgi:hypothetical protein